MEVRTEADEVAELPPFFYNWDFFLCGVESQAEGSVEYPY